MQVTDDPENCVVTETGRQKYVVIDKPIKWLQAQSYCRTHHTDLISGITHINEFKNQDVSPDSWIGLFREIWSWSDGKNFSFRNWDPDSFKDEAKKTCATTTPNGKWNMELRRLPYISSPLVFIPFVSYLLLFCGDFYSFKTHKDYYKVILIKENKTWDEALTYCREKHHDLVSITDRHQQRWVQEKAKMADTEFVWLGMHYTCTLDLWFWVIDRLVCYHNWATDELEECGMAAVMERDGKWYKKADNEKFQFICAI
ncbi:putative C-type lectin domain family 20 member A [Pseudochaenichthys georgianus]|uniref:putative C-type lectin domain family 20 member A n=1 Tax=Pseudochaenichthys georgianus TaxID=52239 RepID=UPI0039C11418